MKNQDDIDIVLDQKWWTHIRYKYFGLELKKKLNLKPELQKEFRELFRKQ